MKRSTDRILTTHVGSLPRPDDLRATMNEVARRSGIAGRLANAVLGHLNTAVRLIAGAVEQAGVYSKSGSPQIPVRIGAMEAVG